MNSENAGGQMEVGGRNLNEWRQGVTWTKMSEEVQYSLLTLSEEECWLEDAVKHRRVCRSHSMFCAQINNLFLKEVVSIYHVCYCFRHLLEETT